MTDVKNNLSKIFINFIPRASHLWFIYMLLGIYLIMLGFIFMVEAGQPA